MQQNATPKKGANKEVTEMRGIKKRANPCAVISLFGLLNLFLQQLKK
jgi:hypothetical protein